MRACAHTHTYTWQVFQWLSTPTARRPNFFGPGTSLILSSSSIWRIRLPVPLEHSSLDGAFADPPLSSPQVQPTTPFFALPNCLYILSKTLHFTCPSPSLHCEFDEDRTIILLHPCPSAQWLSHHRYLVTISWHRCLILTLPTDGTD